MDCMATASPPVLAATATRNRAAGATRRRPEAWEARCRAAAQTASSAPETMRIIHDMTVPLASLVACRVLNRRPEAPVRSLEFQGSKARRRVPPLVPKPTTWRRRSARGAVRVDGHHGQEAAAEDFRGIAA